MASVPLLAEWPGKESGRRRRRRGASGGGCRHLRGRHGRSPRSSGRSSAPPCSCGWCCTASTSSARPSPATSATSSSLPSPSPTPSSPASTLDSCWAWRVHWKHCAARPTVQSTTPCLASTCSAHGSSSSSSPCSSSRPTYSPPPCWRRWASPPRWRARPAWSARTCSRCTSSTPSSVLPLNKFLQSQRKNWVTAATVAAAFPVHIAVSWLLVSRLRFGVLGAAMALSVSGWLVTLLQLAYVVGGGCPVTWSGFSPLAFVDLWGFVKLSVSSGVMVCLETWYYRILILLTGHLKNSELAVNALSICMSFQAWELMIPLGFLAGTGVRVANELGAGNGKGAKFATIVSTMTSFLISLFFSALALAFHDKIALVFSSSQAVIDAVDNISVLLAVTILLNGVQPVLSGVAIGSGWQATVAYVNIGCYYFIGVPIGVLLSWSFNLGVLLGNLDWNDRWHCNSDYNSGAYNRSV